MMTEQKQEIPEGYKLTEVGMIPEDWMEYQLNDVCKSIGDGIHSTPFYSKSGNHYFINGNNISDGKIFISDSTKSISFEEYLKHKINLTEKSLLLSINGTIGNLAFYNNEKVILGKSAAYLTVKDSFSHIYVFYCLQTNKTKSFFEDGLTGTTIKNLGLSTIRNTLIGVPQKLQEQTAIANALSDVDALITELEKLIAKKQAIKTATMQQLLTGKTRLPEFALREDGTPKGYKQSELGEIPEDWEIVKLSNICDIRDGTHDSPKYKDNGIPLVTSKNIVSDVLDMSDISLISENDAYEINKRSKVDKGDIIMSMIGTIGSAVLVVNEPNFCIKNIALFKPKKLSSEYLIQLIKSADFQGYLQDSLDGGIQKFVSLGTLRNLEIILPPDKEQIAIASILFDMDEDIRTAQQRLNKTRQIKQGMMQELLTGKTRLVKPEVTV